MQIVINKITIHCSDSNRASHDDISVIRKWHMKGNGWSDVGYHFFIKKNGEVQEGRKLSKQGAHVAGNNENNAGICLHGIDRFSQQQKISLFNLVDVILDVYDLTLDDVFCHYQFDSSKPCPNFSIEIFKKGFLEWEVKKLIGDLK